MTGLIKIGLGLVAVVAPALVFFRHSDRQVFLPGHTSPGHHQIEKKCDSCHTPLGGVQQQACVGCHGQGLSEAEDSHTPGKFEDPRNALQLGRIDAAHCVECHREHRPEDTDRMSVSARPGFCVECHRDVAREKPNHADLAFTTCTNVGCHNFHDNRAVYTDFLVKHRNEPDLLPHPAVAIRAGLSQAVPQAPEEAATPRAPMFGPAPAPPAGPPPRGGGATVDDSAPGAAAERAPAKVTIAPPDAPSEMEDRGAEGSAGRVPATLAWKESAHARAGVNCSACHRAGGEPTATWTWRPDPTVACARCHEDERRTFFGGKHGMRLAVGLPPMVPADAFVPGKMKPAAVTNAHEKGLTCGRCHDVHGPDVQVAAVETCEGCHNDDHTRNYRLSAHFARWEAEKAGTGAPGTGVSCATCHLPRTVDRLGDTPRVWVDHNQNSNLRPVDKMARSVCMSCHGLAFSLAALADRSAVEANFTGRPRTAPHTGFDLLTRK